MTSHPHRLSGAIFGCRSALDERWMTGAPRSWSKLACLWQLYHIGQCFSSFIWLYMLHFCDISYTLSEESEMVRLGANRAVEGWAKLAKTKCTLMAYRRSRTAEFGTFLTRTPGWQPHVTIFAQIQHQVPAWNLWPTANDLSSIYLLLLTSQLVQGRRGNLLARKTTPWRHNNQGVADEASKNIAINIRSRQQKLLPCYSQLQKIMLKILCEWNPRQACTWLSIQHIGTSAWLPIN